MLDDRRSCNVARYDGNSNLRPLDREQRNSALWNYGISITNSLQNLKAEGYPVTCLTCLYVGYIQSDARSLTVEQVARAALGASAEICHSTTSYYSVSLQYTLHIYTITSRAVTLYGRCCRLHVPQVINDHWRRHYYGRSTAARAPRLPTIFVQLISELHKCSLSYSSLSRRIRRLT